MFCSTPNCTIKFVSNYFLIFIFTIKTASFKVSCYKFEKEGFTTIANKSVTTINFIKIKTKTNAFNLKYTQQQQ